MSSGGPAVRGGKVPDRSALSEWFDSDYLYFYTPLLDGDRAGQDADLILSLLSPPPRAGRLRVLDLACGHGRLSGEFARRGHDVTGVDLSETFLRTAEEENNPGGRVTYLHQDMREPYGRGQFDLVICFFSAFGYFSDEENRRVLANAAAALRPGGQFVLDVRNWDRSGTRMQDHDLIRRSEDFIWDWNTYDPLTARQHTRRLVVRGSTHRWLEFSTRRYSYAELRSELTAAGFRRVAAFDGDGERLTDASARLVVVAGVDDEAQEAPETQEAPEAARGREPG
ncbi:class I SAM-dependent methyltransferase [Streptomyces sp. NPDC050433]|uniref:class I SAM-dependent methyltransferase n=1 Tax=unclassified Streptomyces TaxID=2593676 RepID=UPI00342D166C